jgi:hypothetical protein
MTMHRIKIVNSCCWCSHHCAPRVRQGRVSSRRASRLPRRERARAPCGANGRVIARARWPVDQPSGGARLAAAAPRCGACRAAGGSARSARWQRLRELPRSLPDGLGVRWSPAGGGGSSVRLGWNGRPPRWWIGPGRSAVWAATRLERAARARRGLIQCLIGRDA